MPRAKTRKRPCRICRKWFLPDSRLLSRQKTCGSPECQKQWHKKKCAQWNRRNVSSFRENYLQKKLDSATHSAPSSCAFMPNIPARFIIDWLDLKQFIVIDYLAGCILRRGQPACQHRLSPCKKMIGFQTNHQFVLSGDHGLTN